MNLSLINFNLLNENLTYRMREPFKRKGIRWLELNGGIRWVSLNEMEKAGNERRGKEDKKSKKHPRGNFWILGREHHFEKGGLYYWFLLEEIVGVWCIETGGTCCWDFCALGLGILTESWS